MEKRIKIFTDGASRGNPGLAGIGVVISDMDDKVLKSYKRFIGQVSNNFAEYTALLESINILKNIPYEFDIIDFYLDSELVVKQIKGEYKVKNKELIRLSLEFWSEIKILNKKFSITYISREQNKIADKLANEAIDEDKTDFIDRSLLIKN